ncbi:hypothetical protein V5799_022542 [Amblyomma americanum]|uniref:CCHC-type domain-containing protein n=1 Tax=Amblyomma americanum TaxID=6943 RepID=A0AAQ4FLR1_AMBAM
MGVPVVHVTVYRLPPCISDADLIAAFAPYGKVRAITETAFLGKNSIGNGTRLVKLEMTKAPPNFLTVAGTRAMIEYRGMRRVCSRCGGEGHFGASCKQVRCGRCGSYGHLGTDCRPVCRRCGGAHPTPDCVRPRSYAAAVAASAAKAPQGPGDRPGLVESTQAAGAASSGATEKVVAGPTEPAVQQDDAASSPAGDQVEEELRGSSSSPSETEGSSSSPFETEGSSSSPSETEQPEGTSDTEKLASADSDDPQGEPSLEGPPNLEASLFDAPTAAQHDGAEADTESPGSPSPSDALYTPVKSDQDSDSATESRPYVPHIPVAVAPRAPCAANMMRANVRKHLDLDESKHQHSSASDSSTTSSSTPAPKKKVKTADDGSCLMDVS